MRLDMNTAGAWKLVTREIPAERLEEVKAACVTLCKVGGIKWRLSDDAIGVIAYLDSREPFPTWKAA